MSIKKVWCIAAFMVVMIGSAGLIYSQGSKEAKKSKKPAAGKEAGGDMAAEMAVWAKYAEPGEYHKRLQSLEGTWDAAVKIWMTPNAPPTESKGVSEHKWILGGRFLQQEYKGEFMQKPFLGVGFTGYDNYKKKYTGLWMDNMSTMVWSTLGTCDDSGKVFTFIGQFDDPVSGKKKKKQDILRVVDNDHHIYESYDEKAGGKMHKVMEVTYTRK